MHHGRDAAGDVALHRLLPPINSIRTCAIPRWSASSAAAASGRRCSPHSSASTTISCCTIVLAIIARGDAGRDRLRLHAEAVPMSAPTVADGPARRRSCAAGSASRRASASCARLFYLFALARGRVVAADDRDHSRIPLRRAAADGRSVRAHVADRLGLVPEGRARRADRDAAHRDAGHHSGGRAREPGGADGGAQHHALDRR